MPFQREGKVQINHWGRPCVCTHGSRCTTEPKMKAGDTRLTRQRHQPSHVGPVQRGCGGEALEWRGKWERARQQKAKKREIAIHLIYRLITSKDHRDKGEGTMRSLSPAAIYMFYACVGQEWVCVVLMNASEADWVKRPALLQRQSTADATPQKCHLSVQNNLSPRSPPDWLSDFWQKITSDSNILKVQCYAIFSIFQGKYFGTIILPNISKNYEKILLLLCSTVSQSLYKGHFLKN